MKIVSWNINGYRSITGQNPSRRYDKVTNDNRLFDFVEKNNPDIICLQEIKADYEQINENLKVPRGYFACYHTCKIKKGYSGVATFSKIKPLKENFSLGIKKFDDEGRFIELDFGEFSLMNIYFPKGYADHERLDYKLEFYDYLFQYYLKNFKGKKELIISGDYNTAHKEIDLARPAENTGTSGFIPIEREKLDWMTDNGFVDSFRKFHTGNGQYTWWSQRGRARENNIGWRIDYHFVTGILSSCIKDTYHLPEQDGSDHCPVIMEIDI